MKIFYSLLLEADFNTLTVIERVLTKHYISLHELSWNSLRHLANEMYDVDLFPQTSDGHLHLITSVELSLTRNISQIEKYCTKFLLILTHMGDPCV